jgi:hypothetical protein
MKIPDVPQDEMNIPKERSGAEPEISIKLPARVPHGTMQPLKVLLESGS